MTESLGSTCVVDPQRRSPRPHRRGSIAMVGISDPAVWRPRLLAALVVAAIPRFCRDSETARWHPAFCRSPRRGRPRATRSIVNRRTYGRPGTDDCRSPGRIQRVLPVAGAFRADHTEIIAAGCWPRHSRGRTGGRHTHRPRARSIRRRPPPLIRLKRCGRRGSSPRCSRVGAHWRERSGPQRRNAR
jgi:hypothetical protein